MEFIARLSVVLLLSFFGLEMVPLDASCQAPEWQTKAGGKMAFDVASIRLSQPGTFTPPSFPLSSDDSFRQSGGAFNSDFPLRVLISFAYKLDPDKSGLMEASLPKWALDNYYTIHAKTDNVSTTKDQVRLMVQALLADRFKLVLHGENRDVPVLALTLMKPEKTGPKLIPHSQGPACDAEWPASMPKDEKVYPFVCDVYSMKPTTSHQVMIGSRNTTLALMAPLLNNSGRLGRPLLDRTGLEGRWDFTMEWLPEPKAGAVPDPDAQGPTFLEALHEQLGLKIEPARATLEVLVVDHVEKPSEN